MVNERSIFGTGIGRCPAKEKGKDHEALIKKFLVGFFGRQAMDRQLLISGSSRKMCMYTHTGFLLKNYSRTGCDSKHL